MVTEKYESSFNITIEVEFDLLLRRKRALFLPFVKLVNRINLTIFDHSPDLDWGVKVIRITGSVSPWSGIIT